MSFISNEAEWKYSDYVSNQNYKFDKSKILNTLSKSDIDEAYKTISTWNGYSPTPLIELDKLANAYNKATNPDFKKLYKEKWFELVKVYAKKIERK